MSHLYVPTPDPDPTNPAHIGFVPSVEVTPPPSPPEPAEFMCFNRKLLRRKTLVFGILLPLWALVSL